MTSEQASGGRISQAACKWLLDAVSVDSLHEAIRGLGREAGELLPGFSLSHRVLARPSVRALLARAMLSHPRLAERVLAARSAPWQQWLDALYCLDEVYVLLFWRDLVRSRGPAVIVAMALDDERDPIRRRGERLLARDLKAWSGEIPPMPLEGPLTNLGELLVGPTHQEAAREETNAGRQVAGLEKQCAQLRESVERWKQKATEAESRMSRMAEEHREALRQCRRQIREGEEETTRLHDQFEHRLRTEVAQLREQMLGAPPEPPPSHAPNGKSLAERAAQTLARQDTLDRQRGTRPQLRAELEELEELRKRLQRCCETSLVLVPGIREAATEINQRLQAIRELLGEETTDAHDLATDLIARLKNAHLAEDAPAELARLREFLGLAMVREVLGQQTLNRLAELEKERSEWVADRTIRQTLPPAVPVAVEPEIWNVAERLACYAPATVRLFVDGYNAIRRVPELESLEREQGMAAARDRFCDLCRRQSASFARVEIVFDGTDALAGGDGDERFRIVYSGASGDSQNADEYLAKRMQVARREAGIIWLVTDDFGLRDRVATLCDAYVPPVLFHRYLTVPTT